MSKNGLYHKMLIIKVVWNEFFLNWVKTENVQNCLYHKMLLGISCLKEKNQIEKPFLFKLSHNWVCQKGLYYKMLIIKVVKKWKNNFFKNKSKLRMTKIVCNTKFYWEKLFKKWHKVTQSNAKWRKVMQSGAKWHKVMRSDAKLR